MAPFLLFEVANSGYNIDYPAVQGLAGQRCKKSSPDAAHGPAAASAKREFDSKGRREIKEKPMRALFFCQQ